MPEGRIAAAETDVRFQRTLQLGRPAGRAQPGPAQPVVGGHQEQPPAPGQLHLQGRNGGIGVAHADAAENGGLLRQRRGEVHAAANP